MQPPNLIAVGVSAVLAVGAVETSATAATYSQPHRAAARETQLLAQATPLNPSSAPAATTSESATPSSTETSSSPGSSADAAVLSIGQRSLNQVNRDIDARFDQLQLQNEIQHQLNQNRLRPLPNPAANPLLLDQQLQQQLNQQQLQQMGQPEVGPMRSLDRLQFEQRVRQRLNQPVVPVVPAADPVSRADQRVHQTRRRRASEMTAPAAETTSTLPETAAAPELTQTPTAIETEEEVTESTEATDPAPSANQTPSTDTSAQAPESIETPDLAPASPQPPASPAASPTDAPPEYLDPNPNPLFFPTEPGEVEIVGTQPITLQQAVELAIRNNPDLREARITLERAQADLRNAQAANFPTLDATAQFSQSGQESPVQQPAILGFDPQTGQPIPNPNAGDTDIVTSDSTALGAGIELSYPIFTSGRRSALINAAAGQVRFQELEVERQTEQLILETILDYYALQQAGAQVNIFRANLEQAEQSLRDAQALERAGVGTRFDVLQAEVDVANARQDLTQQLSQLEIARRQLVQRLNLAQSIDISAADPIEVAGVWELGLDESIVQAYKNRVELEQQLIQRDIAQQNRRAALAQLGPQVSFSGAFNLNNDLDEDNGFLYNYQLGIGLRLSLYDGGAARSQANREESNIAIAEAQFEATRDQIRFQVEQAYSQLDANFANIQTTALAVEQATEALRLARLRFQAGVGTQTDVLRQQAALTQAQVNNLQAILDYNRALATLQRAISNYPDGFLSDVP
ncbi:MAG: TolC family protein [Synechococcales cyanobacterium M58_A2018_015]|nr:TolC family protein [Synechococcales cyanobacterium M58_A2018_015]